MHKNRSDLSLTRAQKFHVATAQVDVSDVLSTNRFSIRDTPTQVHAHTGARPAHHSDDDEGKLEHAVKSFVYRARMPFHPARLHAFATRYFQLHQQDWRPALAASAPDRAAASLRHASSLAASAAAALPRRGGAAQAAAQLATDAVRHAAALVAASSTAGQDRLDGAPSAIAPAQTAAALSKERKAEVGHILRSKGFVWLAGAQRNDHCAQWSSAGEVLQVNTGGPWFGALPGEAWPEEPEKRKEILKDFQAGIGDRYASVGMASGSCLAEVLRM